MSTNFGTPRLDSQRSVTYRFGLFAMGADLSVASTVRQLESLGYSHAATPTSSDIHALVFARQAEHLTDAVSGVVVGAECVVGLHIARQACSGAVAVFDPDSMAFNTALRIVAPSTSPTPRPPTSTSPTPTSPTSTSPTPTPEPSTPPLAAPERRRRRVLTRHAVAQDAPARGAAARGRVRDRI